MTPSCLRWGQRQAARYCLGARTGTASTGRSHARKTWTGDDGSGDQIRYPLKRKDYDHLIIKDLCTPRILVLVAVPDDPSAGQRNSRIDRLLTHVGVAEFNLESVARKLEVAAQTWGRVQSWLKAHDDGWMQGFYQLLNGIKGHRQALALGHLPIVRASGGNHLHAIPRIRNSSVAQGRHCGGCHANQGEPIMSDDSIRRQQDTSPAFSSGTHVRADRPLVMEAISTIANGEPQHACRTAYAELTGLELMHAPWIQL